MPNIDRMMSMYNQPFIDKEEVRIGASLWQFR